MKWHSVAPGKTFEDGGEFLVFYNTGSGSTHLINELAAFVLDCLSDGPRSTDDLLSLMAEQLTDTPAEDLQSALSKVLEELSYFELVEADARL